MSRENDVWEYDKKHPEGFNTLEGDNLQPPDSHLPPQVERRLTETYHKDEQPELNVSRADGELNQSADQVFQRRRSSVTARRKSSRKATGSYGDDNELKPLSGLSQEDKVSAMSGSALFFSNGIPTTTSGNN